MMMRVGAIVSVFALGAFAACGSDDCAETATCASGGPGGPDGGSSSGATTDGPILIPPPNCDLAKAPTDSPACIADAVAVFVAPNGKDDAAGTRAAPVQTIAKGL